MDDAASRSFLAVFLADGAGVGTPASRGLGDASCPVDTAVGVAGEGSMTLAVVQKPALHEIVCYRFVDGRFRARHRPEVYFKDEHVLLADLTQRFTHKTPEAGQSFWLDFEPKTHVTGILRPSGSGRGV